MNKYTKLSEQIKAKYNLTHEELGEMIKKAQLWHNPLNYSNGDDLKEKYGWDNTFTEALEYERAGNRYYFKFHDYDLTDIDTTYDAFRNCKNFEKYSKIWKKHAPKGLKSPAIYLLALVEMTVKGFRHEQAVIEKLVREGNEVRVSTAEEDIKGVDIWVNGEAYQIKSEKTLKGMKQYDKGIKVIGD